MNRAIFRNFPLGHLLPLFFMMLALAVSACVKIGTPDSGKQPTMAMMESRPSSQPLVSVCLAGVNGDGRRKVRATIEAIELSDGSQWVALLPQSLAVTSDQAGRGVLLGRASVPAAQYQRIRYRIGAVTVAQDGREVALTAPAQPVECPLAKPLALAKDDSISLFVLWDIAASLGAPPNFRITFKASEQKIPLTSELAFVSCPEINTVYVVRTDQNRICGSWGIPGRPTSIHVSKEANVLCVLASAQATIVKVELSSGLVRDRIRIPMAARPTFMAVDQEGHNAFLIEQSTGMVFKVDLVTGSLVSQVRLGERLDYGTILEESKLVAVSSSQGQKVVLLDPTTLRTRQILAVGNVPLGVAEYAGNLYVAESRANTVGLYNLSNRTILRQQVGQGPSRLIVSGGMLYVANSVSGSISILRPEGLTVVKEMTTGGSPGEMAVSAIRNWLYSVNGDGNGVGVLDLASQRRAVWIDLKTAPDDIAVIQ